MFGEVARLESKQAIVIGEMGASVAPATTASTLPSWISPTAWARASIPEVQPVEITQTGPRAPHSQATSRAKELGTRWSNRCGTT